MYLSLFSGIEAVTQAWHNLGFEPVAFAEIEPFPCSLLAHYYPDVPNLGDVTKITEDDIKKLGHIDIVVFGSPCQNLSIAGNRQGLTDTSGKITRSGLFYEAIRIFKLSGARFAVWENVPGAFSSNKGRDFAAVVEQMAGIESVSIPAYGWGSEGAAVGDNGLLEWCVLDAQWFGLAQRRKRVFAVLDAGNWLSRPPILIESESLRRDTPPSRETGQAFTADVAPSLVSSGRGVKNIGETRGQDAVVAVAGTLNRSMSKGKNGQDVGNLIAFPERMSATQSASSENLSPNLCSTNPTAIAYGLPGNWIGRKPENGGNTIKPMIDISPSQTKTDVHAVAFRAAGQEGFSPSELSPPLTSTDGGGNVPTILSSWSVRRLTPIECERLMGFPDNYTSIIHKGKPASDSARYKALGNSMAIPVIAWIGQKIKMAVEHGNGN